LKQQDELVAVRLAREEDDIIMVTRMGQGIRFPTSQLAIRSRQASTVRGIRIARDDQVIAMDIALPNAHILTLSQRGFGKLTPITSYPVHNRGGHGVRAFRITEKSGAVAAAHIVAECQEIIVGSAKAMVIRTPLVEIPSLGRNTQGVMVMRKLAPDDRVVSVACLNEGTPLEPAPVKKTAKGTASNGRNSHRD
jgi:DNA gyrase subunit A